MVCSRVKKLQLLLHALRATQPHSFADSTPTVTFGALSFVKMSDETAQTATQNPMHAVGVDLTAQNASVVESDAVASSAGKSAVAFTPKLIGKIALGVVIAGAIAVGVGLTQKQNASTAATTEDTTDKLTLDDAAEDLSARTGLKWYKGGSASHGPNGNYEVYTQQGFASSDDFSILHITAEISRGSGLTAGDLYRSMDAGASFTGYWNRYTSRMCTDVDSSSNGLTVIMVEPVEKEIGISLDGGVTLAMGTLSFEPQAVAITADGQNAFLATRQGKIYTADASDGFDYWTVLYEHPGINGGSARPTYTDIDCSADGRLIIVVSAEGVMTYIDMQTQLMTNTDYRNARFTSVSVSSDGTTVMLAADNARLLVSSDGGDVFNDVGNSLKYTDTCVSADGQKMAATVMDGQVWYSEDAGNTWYTITTGAHKWAGLACASDLSQLIVGTNDEDESNFFPRYIGRFE